MSYIVEKDWIAHGLRCVMIIFRGRGHRCGYVGVPKEHPLYEVSYSTPTEVLSKAFEKAKQGPIGKRGIIPILCVSESGPPRADCVFDVHGSLTYSGNGDYPVKSDGLWWFGFDCSHYGDAPDPEYVTPPYNSVFRGGEVRSREYVKGECESLAKQLAAICDVPETDCPVHGKCGGEEKK